MMEELLKKKSQETEAKMEEISKKKGIYDPAFNGVMITPLPEDELVKKRAEVAQMTEEQKKNIFEFDNGDYVDYSKDPDVSFAEDLEADEDGYKPITWTQLKRSFCYERPAKKFKLYGDISQKPREHWERSKHIKVRDEDGCEGAVFFYDDNFDFENIEVGNHLEVKSPRLHRFMDGQEGMRVESCNATLSKVKKERFSDAKRLDYGELNKTNGNRFFEKGKYEDAMGSYDQAIKHLEGTFHEEPENEQKAKELVASCYLNIAACHIAEKKWRFVEVACNKALRINATLKQNAKAYFRIGQAAIELSEYSIATEALTKANKMLPEDPRIVEELARLNKEILSQKEAEKSLFKKEREANKKEFGVKRKLLTAVPTELGNVSNFRDLGNTLVAGRDSDEDEEFNKTLKKRPMKIKKHLLYRSSNFSLASTNDVKILTDDFGMKTILDLRNNRETSKARSIAKKKNKTIFADFQKTFLPVSVKCGKNTAAPVKLSVPNVSGKTREEVLAKRVTYNVDLVTNTVMAIVDWWVWILVMILGAFLQIRLASKLIINHTARKVGVLGFYKLVLKHQKPELKLAFDLICNPESYPLAISCSMGKDRTGICTALALAALGVSDHEIAMDYSRSTAHLSKELIGAQRELGLGKDWEVCDAKTMLDLFSHIREEYGSVHKYLTKDLNVSEEQLTALRKYLLVDVDKAYSIDA